MRRRERVAVDVTIKQVSEDTMGNDETAKINDNSGWLD